MRGMVPGLRSSAPFGPRLPAVLQEDELMSRFLLGFDESLAPMLATLDMLDSYLDPDLTPEDFLPWLAQWVGVDLPDSGETLRNRQTIRDAVPMHRARGTKKGLLAAVKVALPLTAEVSIDDSGGSAASTSPGTPFPGREPAGVLIRIKNVAGAELNLALIEATVREAKPAHIPHRIEVLP